MRRSFLLSALCLAAAGPAFALEAVSPALEAMVLDLSANGGRAIWRDLDGDGSMEAVVWPADETGAPGQTWRIIAGEVPQEVFSWTSAETEIVDTPPQGAVVMADGITWAWTGRRVRPHYDLVVQNVGLITPPQPDERAMMAGVGYTDIVDELTQVLRLDLVEQILGREKIIALADEMYRLEDGSTPYFIFSDEGLLLVEGLSIFHPAIFHHPEGGVTLIEETGEGMSLVRLGGPSATLAPETPGTPDTLDPLEDQP